jgi:predicted PurR-regulated permease PerM
MANAWKWNFMIKADLFKKILVFVIYALFALLFWPFLKPLLFAILFAFALNPVVQKAKNKFPKVKNYKVLVAGFLTVILTVFFTPVFILIISAIGQIKKIQAGNINELPIFKNAQSAIETVIQNVQSIADRFDFDFASNFDLNSIFSKISEIILPALTSIATQLPVLMVNFLIFIIALYLLLTNKDFFNKWFLQLNIVSNDQFAQLSKLIEKICHLVLISTVVVATSQALVISMASLIAGYNNFIIIFMVAFFMAFVPVIGSAPVAIVLVLYSFMNSNITASVVLIVAGLISASVDNVIRAYMLTGEGTSGIHPFISLLAVIGSLSLFGLTGLFLGPIICELAFQIGGILFQELVPESDAKSTQSV